MFVFLSYAELSLFLFGIGKEEVVHLVGSKKDGGASQPDSVFTICGETFNKASVKKESVWNVVQDSKVEINNTKDRVCRYTSILKVSSSVYL